MTRDMTPDEAYAIHVAGRCPNCGGKQFFSGPCGSILRNMRCSTPSCALLVNIVDTKMQDTVDLDTRMALGQILDAPANYKQAYGKRPFLYRILKLMRQWYTNR